ncbi:hypothetical protein COLO4_08423 [Corchorus olitorius]|uniref:ribonuclease Z n=1 Tax=Corchorus olitorius TaxID=93759 RepID=A0A1R3KFU5_9ROSI|nr:hypothetical protein COLO4_08423 [Corchorus olitorius]
MSLKGRGQGVDLGTSTSSLIRSIIFSFLGLVFPYDPLNHFPFFVFLSPLPHRIGARIAAVPLGEADVREGHWPVITLFATAPHHCIIAISFFEFSLTFPLNCHSISYLSSMVKTKEFKFNQAGQTIKLILGIGMDTQDTTPSVLLFFDKQRFIFNAGEGLQRFCTEHKIKLSKVNIWGPSNLNLLVDAMKCFIPHYAMVHTHLISHTGPLQTDSPSADASKFKDVKISAILLQPNGVEGSAVSPSDVAIVYVCELHELKWKFHKEKADALGVKVKTKFKELTEGKSVKPDCLDITVHPSDVIGPPVPGPIVIIVDCPTDSHAKELLCTQSLNEYYSDSGPASVVNSSTYNKWMKKFGSAQHVMAGHVMKQVDNPILKSSARMAAQLNYLCPRFFPPLSSWPIQDHSITAPGPIFSTEDPVSKSESILAENLLKFTLHPHTHFGLDRSNVPCSIKASGVIDQLLLESPDIADAAQDVKQLWQKPAEKKECTISMHDFKIKVEELIWDEDSLPGCLEDIRRDDLEIIFLWTGSSQPSKYRKCVCYLFKSFLYRKFASGLWGRNPGTIKKKLLKNLENRYGMEGSKNAVKNLACVWISHIHADHHVGLVRILALRRELLKRLPHEPLIVIGPSQLERFLDAYQRLEDLDMQFFDNRTTTIAPWETFELDNESNNNKLFPESDEEIELASKDGESLQQTRPCLEMIEASQGATILIHEATFEEGMDGEAIAKNHSTTKEAIEATFEEGMDGEAIAKNHSTTKEAIEVGDSAAAYRIILAHFSQRYPKIPELDEISMQKTCIAFDFMSINIADLSVLPEVIPYLKLLFKSEMMIDNSNDVVETDA